MKAPKRTGPDPGMSLGQKYFAAGLRFAGGVVVFTLGGYGLDRWLHTVPLFTLVGTFAGAGLSFLSVYREVVTDRQVDEDGPAGKW